jgi:hypothetical protein
MAFTVIGLCKTLPRLAFFPEEILGDSIYWHHSEWEETSGANPKFS